MTTTTTENKAPPVIDVKAETSSLVISETTDIVNETMGEQQILAAMAQHGMIVPISTPAGLRQLYSMRQKMYAAILDESDYLWIVHYQESKNGKSYGRQYIARDRKEADDRAEAVGGRVSGKPVKSGVQKLAEALGITARCVVREERSYMGRKGIYCEYEAQHEKTGKIESGVGFCGADERRGNIGVHDMLTTADTRAYNRAVLRLAAFGDVSAEEIIAGVGTNELPEFVPDGAMTKAPAPLPDIGSDEVLTAARVYMEALSERDVAKRYAPDAKQDTLSARASRAAARRGDVKAAKQMGVLGVRWEGVAQDSADHMTFDVAPPPAAAAPVALAPENKPDKLVEALGGEAPPAEANGGKPAGWDLSGIKKGDDAGLPPDLPERHTPAPKSGIPQPDQGVDSITVAQAKKVSRLLVDVLGSKEGAKAWLQSEAHVERSIDIRSNQYETIMSVLKKKKES